MELTQVQLDRIERRKQTKGLKGRAKVLHRISTRDHNPTLVCFYTGVVCRKNAAARGKRQGPWLATIEHLIPRSEGGSNDLDNLVVATAFANSLVSNAPLIVKLQVKEKLKDLKFFPGVTSEQRYTITRKFIRGFLLTFRIPGINRHPWHWRGHEVPEELDALKARNDELLELSQNIRV